LVEAVDSSYLYLGCLEKQSCYDSKEEQRARLGAAASVSRGRYGAVDDSRELEDDQEPIPYSAKL
jgi:hypothetical protein